MLSANEVRRGMFLRIDDNLCEVVESRHQKIGRGGANLILKLRNVDTGASVDRSFPATKRYERVRLDSRQIQYMYDDPSGYHFMDMESFEEVTLTTDLLGDATKYLIDGMEIDLLVEGERPLSVELPPSVEMEVVEAPPGHKGDTATAGTKPATTQTGVVVQVPLFVNRGDRIRVDTRSGAYLERV
ncbi:MAG: elongation factor P [Chloroflexi bacterium]|nr:elongation factor P [Chloroflexota bacterium]MCY3938310.1 elongation factor P [Chloroflexota bacterium]